MTRHAKQALVVLAVTVAGAMVRWGHESHPAAVVNEVVAPRDEAPMSTPALAVTQVAPPRAEPVVLQGFDAGQLLGDDVRGLAQPIAGGATRQDAELAASKCFGLPEIIGGRRLKPRDDDGFITGRVLRANGSVMRASRVVATSGSALPLVAIFNEGRYGLRVRPGHYSVWAAVPEEHDQTAELAMAALSRPTIEVEVAPREVVLADLRVWNDRGRVRVRVVDDAGPVAQAQIFVDRFEVDEEGAVPVSDANGYVEVLVTAGRHRVAVWAPGHGVWLTTIDLATDGLIDLGMVHLDSAGGQNAPHPPQQRKPVE